MTGSNGQKRMAARALRDAQQAERVRRIRMSMAPPIPGEEACPVIPAESAESDRSVSKVDLSDSSSDESSTSDVSDGPEVGKAPVVPPSVEDLVRLYEAREAALSAMSGLTLKGVKVSAPSVETPVKMEVDSGPAGQCEGEVHRAVYMHECVRDDGSKVEVEGYEDRHISRISAEGTARGARGSLQESVEQIIRQKRGPQGLPPVADECQ